MMIYNDPPPGMFIVPDKDDMTTVRILSIRIFFAVNLNDASERCSCCTGMYGNVSHMVLFTGVS